MTIEVGKYTKYREWLMRSRSIVQSWRDKYSMNVFEISYEDLVSSHGKNWKRSLIGYLGVSVNESIIDKMEEHSWKKDDDDKSAEHVRCSERITNWDEVKASLEGTAELELCEKDIY